MSDSVQPHRRQPTRLPCPRDSQGKNTGVGCHFLLQCIRAKSESEVAQLCPTLSDPMDCSLPGSSVRGIFQARVLEWGAISPDYLPSGQTVLPLWSSPHGVPSTATRGRICQGTTLLRSRCGSQSHQKDFTFVDEVSRGFGWTGG